MRKRQLLAMLAAAPLSRFALAQGDRYPSRLVKIVVPLAAGSGGDTFTRFFAEKLSAVLGQTFVVDNMPGGNGIIAAMAVKHAPADGYTILQGTGATMSVNPVTLKNLPYDPLTDFKPVSGLIKGAAMVVVPEGSKLRSFQDLIAQGRTAQAPLNAGTYSPAYQLALAWLASLTGIKVTNVPYKGGSQLSMDVVGGQLDFALSDVSGASAMVKGGKTRALAISDEQRHKDYPDVPTIRESGFAEFVFFTWASLFVRAETPDSVVTTLAEAMQKIFKTDEAEKTVATLGGADLMPLGPAEMRKFQVAEYERNKRLAEIAGIVPQ
jgi:tripartite-type tricarboxylate transporter receptor subunit TctC